MAGYYTVPYSGTLTNAGGDTDLFELNPADDKPIVLADLYLGAAGGTADAADAQEELLRVSIIRLPATVTSGNGTSVTPAAQDSAQAAAGFTAEANGATVATTSGSALTLYELEWNPRVQGEWHWPDYEKAPKARQGEAIVVRLQTTVADDIALVGTAGVYEY